MPMKLYYDFMSQPARACYILFKCAAIPFEGRFINLKKGEHLTEEYGKINYFLKVPSIDDGGFKLSESIAIMKYVLNKYNGTSTWIPRDAQIEARVDEFLHWYHLNLRMNFGMYFRKTVLLPILTGEPANQEAGSSFLKSMQDNLKSMNNYFLSTPNSFIGGSPTMTIADILAACEISQIDYLNFSLSEFLTKDDTNYPNVLNWYNLVKSGTQPHFDECHKILVLVKQKLDKTQMKSKL